MNSPIDNRLIENVYIRSVCALALLITGSTDSFACVHISTQTFFLYILLGVTGYRKEYISE